jgi:hypothetical protein
MKLAYFKPVLMKRESLSKVTAGPGNPLLTGNGNNGGAGS